MKNRILLVVGGMVLLMGCASAPERKTAGNVAVECENPKKSSQEIEQCKAQMRAANQESARMEDRSRFQRESGGGRAR